MTHIKTIGGRLSPFNLFLSFNSRTLALAVGASLGEWGCNPTASIALGPFAATLKYQTKSYRRMIADFDRIRSW